MEQGSQGFVLCGGIGAGKSYVGALFEADGVEMIEADAIGHQVLAPGGACVEPVASRWPSAVIDGVIDRRKLGAIVFNNTEQLRLLESITHPAIANEIAARIDTSRARLVGIERPFLTGLVGDGLPVIVVDAPPELRVNRLLQRGMRQEEIDARMAAQPDRQSWLDGADFVIDNDRGADLAYQVASAIRWLENFVTGNR